MVATEVAPATKSDKQLDEKINNKYAVKSKISHEKSESKK